MSTTVTYKGQTLTTAENQTRTLLTAGKYMEDDLTITDVTQGGGGGVTTATVTIPYGNLRYTDANMTVHMSGGGAIATDMPVGSLAFSEGAAQPGYSVSGATQITSFTSGRSTYRLFEITG